MTVRSINIVTGEGETREYTPTEHAANAVAQALWDENNTPIKVWERAMVESDTLDMSREMEDHISDQHSGITGNVYTQAKYDAKTVKRSQKPV